MQSLESEVEQLLLRMNPESASQWVGATAEEIARIEKIAGQPLPRFYRWFLSTMGRNMGPVAYPSLDLSVSRILATYASGKVRGWPGSLLIGYDDDEMMSLHYFYDLKSPIRDDARVFRASLSCAGRMEEAETLRERIVTDEVDRRISSLPQRCDGTFKADDFEVFVHLDPIMEGLGFRQPIHTGNFSRIYERADAAMTCEDTPEEGPDKFRPSISAEIGRKTSNGCFKRSFEKHRSWSRHPCGIHLCATGKRNTKPNVDVRPTTGRFCGPMTQHPKSLK